MVSIDVTWSTYTGMRKFARFLSKYLELVLNVLSIPIIVLIHVFISMRFDRPWMITAFAAVAIGILHGTIGWFVRSQQRRATRQLLVRLREIVEKSILEPVAANPAANFSEKSMVIQAAQLALAQLAALSREPLAVQSSGQPRELKSA